VKWYVTANSKKQAIREVLKSVLGEG